MIFSISSIAAQPGWSVNESDYQYSMTNVCVINIEGEISNNTNDIIAAFINDECRGVASPSADGKVFMTIYSNSAQGEVVVLKVWDSKNNKEYTLSQTLQFEEGASYGDLQNPITLHTNIKNYRLKAFNVFSPNGDDVNDKWIVEDLSLVSNLQLVIFSVNGVEVYKHSAKGYDNTWEGKNKNGSDLPSGTYIYQFLDNDNKAIFRGSITIVR